MRRLIFVSALLILLNACASQSINNNSRLPTVAGAPTCPGEDCWQSEVMTDVLSSVIEYRLDKAERQQHEPLHSLDDDQ